MSDFLAYPTDDRSAGGADIVYISIEIENPAECLRRRTDVVFCRGEHDDRRGNTAKIKDRFTTRLELIPGQLVAGEEVIDQELQLVVVQLDKVAPPFLEPEIALRIGVDMRIDFVLLCPTASSPGSECRSSGSGLSR